MPVEFLQLLYKLPTHAFCPKCQAKPFKPFMRGQVQSIWRKIFKRPYCAVICQDCKDIIDWEQP